MSYVTESLRLQGQGKTLAKSWFNEIRPQKRESRSGEEIAMEIIKKGGLKQK